MDRSPVFLAGATSFVGSNLYPLLLERGYEVRNGTRSPESSRDEQPDRTWVEFDVQDPSTLRPALSGCKSALYLIHMMGGGGGYPERERQAAHAFLEAAEDVELERIVYLGGVAPQGVPSLHLESRLDTGRILRSGNVSTIELRASMVIGAGSASWQIVRDIATRLPALVFPRWTKSRTQPVAIDDVVVALLGALELETSDSEWYDIPGPDLLTVEEIFLHTARLVGNDPPAVHVPFLSPKLSSYWLKLVTRANYKIARELVEGLKTDLIAHDDRFWELIAHHDLVDFDEATRRALSGAPAPGNLSERVLLRLGRAVRGGREIPTG